MTDTRLQIVITCLILVACFVLVFCNDIDLQSHNSLQVQGESKEKVIDLIYNLSKELDIQRINSLKDHVTLVHENGEYGSSSDNKYPCLGETGKPTIENDEDCTNDATEYHSSGLANDLSYSADLRTVTGRTQTPDILKKAKPAGLSNELGDNNNVFLEIQPIFNEHARNFFTQDIRKNDTLSANRTLFTSTEDAVYNDSYGRDDEEVTRTMFRYIFSPTFKIPLCHGYDKLCHNASDDFTKERNLRAERSLKSHINSQLSKLKSAVKTENVTTEAPPSVSDQEIRTMLHQVKHPNTRIASFHEISGPRLPCILKCYMYFAIILN